MLRDIGAEHVIVSTKDESWKKELEAKVEELGTMVAFDAVAGRSTGDILDCLPSDGTVYVYGGLAGKVENIDPMALIYRRKQVKGFVLTRWIEEGGMMQSLPCMYKAGKIVNPGLGNGGWSSSQFTDTTMETMQQDLVKLMESGATGQKLRVRMDKK